MKKEFSFKNYVVYALRYWLVLAICAVVGLGAGLLYGILSDRDNGVVYEGNIAVAGISSFFDSTTMEKETNETYNLIRSNAINAMIAEQVRADLFTQVQSEWMALKNYSASSLPAARKSFLSSLSVRQSGIYVYVSFSQQTAGDKENAFSEKAVNTYIELAKDAAADIEKIFTEGDKLIVTNASRVDSIESDSMGIFMSSIIGTVIGVVLGALAMLIVYLADRKITSYNDIASFTGRKLLSVGSGAASNKVCPRIDCEMDGKNMLLICGSEQTSRRVAEMYGEYAYAAGRNAVRVDFTRGDNDGDSFGEYMRGEKPLNDCITDENGVAVLKGNQSWALALTHEDKIESLKKQFGRVIMCAPYRGDGSLGVLAKVSDKVVYAIDQSALKAATVLDIAQELQSSDKAIGAVIEKTGKSFVGGSVYLEADEEE